MTQRKKKNPSKPQETDTSVDQVQDAVEVSDTSDIPQRDVSAATTVEETAGVDQETSAQEDDTAPEAITPHDPSPTSPDMAQPTNASARSPMAVLTLGWIGAGVAGGMVAQYANSGWPFDGSIFPARTAQVEYVTVDAVATIEEQIASLAPRADVAMAADVQSLRATVTELAAQMAAFEARLADASGPSAEDIAQMQSDFERLSSTLGSVQEVVQTQEQLRQERAVATQTAQARVALAHALETGAPFEDVLADLEAVGMAIPDALRAAAVSGAPTVSSLTAEFPQMAREALAADRGQGSDGASAAQGVGQFLKKQLGLRSVTPKEGTSTDAVLSRMEGALRAGDLRQAAQEAEGLSGEAAQISAPWREALATRLAIDTAVDALTAPEAQ